MAASKLCAAIMPTRNTVQNLRRALFSYFSQAVNPTAVEVVLRIDNDNTRTMKAIPDIGLSFPNTRFVIGPRYDGYISMPRFVMEAAAETSATWLFLMDDDAEINGPWDRELMKVTAPAAQAETYHLNNSKYKNPDGNGPVGLFVPNLPPFTQLPETGAVDQIWLDRLRERKMKVGMLAGITYRHFWDDHKHRKR